MGKQPQQYQSRHKDAALIPGYVQSAEHKLQIVKVVDEIGAARLVLHEVTHLAAVRMYFIWIETLGLLKKTNTSYKLSLEYLAQRLTSFEPAIKLIRLRTRRSVSLSCAGYSVVMISQTSIKYYFKNIQIFL